MAALLSDLPIESTIMEAEEKHGYETHMVIECVCKEDLPEQNTGLETEDTVYWWVEFEEEIKTFEKFQDVRKFLLEDAVSSKTVWKEKVLKKSKVV